MSNEDNEPATERRPIFMAVEPQLFVTNVEASCDYYADKLGFTVAFLYGDPPYYGQIYRDGVQLNLRQVDRLPFDQTFRSAEEDALSATILVEDVAALAAEYEASGATFHQQLRTEEWGTSTIIVSDPDGNLIAFAG
ncbi:catechol 2,3-dioxygenase-like lactoylglutathione lyase family enzyme [Mycoplana sp. BE70]|uniref:VOC family protein n=1 Tax=Mycoplana sp. BE70 TaxID=2817775 RepID=UPI00286772F5|nr:VOC family protein [Mycoplana sp. BE70]MDR6758805.1 catechol 2,3-dioxygenase-like lactoylglutathione lyase family enzyme [Mycoplana sp. BE70]